MKKGVIIAVVVGLILAGIGGYFVYKTYNKPHRSVADEEAAFTFTDAELAALFSESATAGEEKLKNKVIAVSGTVKKTETANGFVVVNQTPSASISFDGTTLTASPAGFAYQWYLNGAVLGGANSQQLTPTQNGSYTVEVFGNGDCNDLSTPWIINGLSLENVALDGNIQVYPNPAQDMVYITRNGNLSGNWNFKLLNAVGAQIKTVQNSQNDQVILDLSDVAAGVYYLHINTQTQGELIKKLVIMK